MEGIDLVDQFFDGGGQSGFDLVVVGDVGGFGGDAFFVFGVVFVQEVGEESSQFGEEGIGGRVFELDESGEDSSQAVNLFDLSGHQDDFVNVFGNLDERSLSSGHLVDHGEGFSDSVVEGFEGDDVGLV